MRISPPAPAWIPLVDCLTTLQRLEFSPTAGVPRLSSGPNWLRKTPTSQGNETFTSALAGESQAQKIPPEAIPFPSSEAETPKSRQPLFTLAQVMTFFIFFTILAAALLMGLFFARGVK